MLTVEKSARVRKPKRGRVAGYVKRIIEMRNVTLQNVCRET